MYKIAILGCENSHADSYLDFIVKDKIYTDIEVLGIYSDEEDANIRLSEKYGVPVMENYDSLVGRVDGIVITARHGDNHYKYAKPYMESGIPMYIDKPITVSEEDAVAFKADLIKHNIRVCGGSILKFPQEVQEFKKNVAEETYGKVFGGFARAPVYMENAYGNFFFYAQHLVQTVGEIFGYFPNSVKAYVNGDIITCIARYDQYDVCMTFTEGNYKYIAGISCAECAITKELNLDDCFQLEFKAFYDILTGKEQEQPYDEFFAPVFFLNAIDRSIKSGNEEKVSRG